MIELIKLTVTQAIFTVIILMVITYFFRKILTQFICLESFPNIFSVLPEKRKPFGEEASSVTVGLFVHNFPEFNIEKGHFSIDGIVWFEFYPSQISIEDLGKFEFFEGKITKKSLAEIKKDNDRIFVAYNFEVEFISQLNYKKFPFADHRIFLILKHAVLSSKELNFYAGEREVTFKDKLYPNGWKIESTSIETGYSKVYLKNHDEQKTIFIPVAVFEFCFSKPGLRQLLLTVVPPLLLYHVALLSLVFDLSSNSSGDSLTTSNISLTLGTMSAIIFHRFIIEHLSPKVGYFSLVDFFYTIFLTCNFLIFVLHMYGVDQISNCTIKYASFYIIQIIVATLFGLLLVEKEKDHKKTINKPKLLFRSRFFHAFKIDYSALNLKYYQGYANSLEEFPLRDNINPLTPNYAGYLKRKSKKHLTNIISFLLNRKKLPFQCHIYFSLKETLSALVKGNFLEEKSSQRHVLLHSLKKGEKFYIWGSLHGAFHSLVRALDKLKEQGVINNDLKILEAQYYFIFNGNAIEGSPYNLETISLIATLLIKNPNNVFYVKGLNEKRNFSLNLGLKEEIRIIEKMFTSDKNSLENLFNQFFYSLPETIYLESSKNKGEYITISSDSPILFEPQILESAFTACAHNNFAILIIKESAKKTNGSFIAVQLRGLENKENYKKLKGVDLLPFQNGSTRWSIFSSPIQAHKEYFDFHLDAYGILNVPSSFQESSIARLSSYFHAGESFIEESFNLFSGARLGTEDTSLKGFIPAREIRIGSSLDLAQTARLLGERLKRGLDLSIRKANKEGGILK